MPCSLFLRWLRSLSPFYYLALNVITVLELLRQSAERQQKGILSQVWRTDVGIHGVGRAAIPLEVLGEHPSIPLTASGGCCQSLAWGSIFTPCFHHHLASSAGCVCPCFFSSYKDTSRAALEISLLLQDFTLAYILMASSKTRFLNKVIFTETRRLELQSVYFWGHNPTCNKWVSCYHSLCFLQLLPDYSTHLQECIFLNKANQKPNTLRFMFSLLSAHDMSLLTFDS